MLALVLLAFAANNVQGMIDRAEPGALIELPAGEIREHLHITKPLTLRGAGVGKTLLRGKVKESVVTISSGTGVVRLESLSITGGENSAGGGVLHSGRGELIIEDVEVYENSAMLGGGIFSRFRAGPITLRRLSVHHNRADSGGGIGIASDKGTIEACTVEDNVSVGAFAAVSKELSIKDVRFSKNTNEDGATSHAHIWCAAPGCSVAFDRLTFDGPPEGAVILGERGEKIPKVIAKNMTWPLGQ
jgi:hypothetical protein